MATSPKCRMPKKQHNFIPSSTSSQLPATEVFLITAVVFLVPCKQVPGNFVDGVKSMLPPRFNMLFTYRESREGLSTQHTFTYFGWKQMSFLLSIRFSCLNFQLTYCKPKLMDWAKQRAQDLRIPVCLAADTQLCLKVCKGMTFCSCSIRAAVNQLFSHLSLALRLPLKMWNLCCAN